LRVDHLEQLSGAHDALAFLGDGAFASWTDPTLRFPSPGSALARPCWLSENRWNTVGPPVSTTLTTTLVKQVERDADASGRRGTSADRAEL
jgi:hypothetical protein